MARRSGRNVQDVVAQALKAAKRAPRDLAAIGITNQRETTIVWDKASGKPIHNAHRLARHAHG